MLVLMHLLNMRTYIHLVIGGERIQNLNEPQLALKQVVGFGGAYKFYVCVTILRVWDYKNDEDD